MLIAEARWIGAALAALPDSAFPLVNVGCQTERFQTVEQPWIDEYVFGPLRSRDVVVLGLDIRDEEGVDIVADVTTEDGQRAIRDTGARTVLCANLLEHVPDPDVVLSALCNSIPDGGDLIVSGPLAFPYHPDPIDTMFRPTSREMAARITPELTVRAGADIRCRRLIVYALRSRRDRARTIGRILLPFLKPRGWWSRMRSLAAPTKCYAVHATRQSD